MTKPTEPLAKYAWLKEEISKLEDELDAVKDEVFTIVDESGGKIDNDAFVIRSQKRPKYKYSDEYEAKNKELKALKKSEIEDEIATIEGYSEYVTIKFKD